MRHAGKPAIALVAVLIVVAGCHWRGVEGDGNIKTESRPMADFSGLKVTGGYRIEWSGGKPSLTISADENLLPLIRTDVIDGTLQVDSKESLRPTRDITIILSSSALAEVHLTGGNSLQARQVSGPQLKLGSTGASDITVDGSVTTLDVTMTGASKLRAKSLQVRNAALSLTGASDADVNVTDKLKVSVTGAGSLTYSGNPALDQRVTGAGSIRHRE